MRRIPYKITDTGKINHIAKKYSKKEGFLKLMTYIANAEEIFYENLKIFLLV